MNKLKKSGGFTLVELIIVIAILAVLASIAVPNLLGSVEKSRKAKDIANAKLIGDTVTMWMVEEEYNSSFTNYRVGLSGGTLKIYLEKNLSTLPRPVSKEYKGIGYFCVNHDGNGNITVTTTDDDKIILYPEVKITTTD